MHPIAFHLSHHLSDWPECFIELHCPTCRRSSVAPTKLLMHRHGDMPVMEALKRSKCSKCRMPPAPVYLCASHHRQFMHGPQPDWRSSLCQSLGRGPDDLPS